MKRKIKKIILVFSTLLILIYSFSYLSIGFDKRNILKNLDPISIYEKLSQARKFSTIKQTIINEYVEDVDEELLLKTAYSGMIGSMNDEYSAYFSKEELEDYLYHREGAFAGIGISIQTDYENLTMEVMDFIGESPAKKAGVKKGDLIISADGFKFDDEETLKEMINRIKGEEGTSVMLGIYRKTTDEFLAFTIKREKILVNNVSREIIDTIGYIIIKSFTIGVSKDFKEACEYLKEEDVKALIIDVRGNVGGSLNEVLDISDYFLGDVMITYVEDRYGNRKEYYSDIEYFDIPIVILVNKNSASASELFAGAVKDNDRGVIFGETTFGKGIVQTDFYLSDGSGFKITTKKYYIP